ncbi:CRAL-TRIO domain-containing protein [Spinellus fusiger]|nr:CRAL-TRIO domain-containing protein [Spinellus fusiger]
MVTDAQPISLENRQPGHAGCLTENQTESLKNLWTKLFELFAQAGTPYTPPSPKPVQTEVKKAGGFFGFGAKKEPVRAEVFLGATTDSQWLSLPLEKALELIPGTMLHKTFWNMVSTDNPDAAVCRFLRARKWDLEASYKMLANALRWRLVMRMDEITALGESGLQKELNATLPGMGDSFIEQLNSGKARLGGPDKASRGLCFINAQFHHKEEQSLEVVKLLTLYVMETSRLFCGFPMEYAGIVFNLENFTMSNMDFDFVKFFLNCLEAYYPETLGACYIHKAPWVFSTVWSMITPLLDPVVASKIQFTKNIEELTEFIDIGSLPVIISGNPDRKTKDEATEAEPPIAGTLEPIQTPETVAYTEAILQYENVTKTWTETKSEEEATADALQRLEHGRTYRVARIKAEKDLRAPTLYHAKGLVKLTENGRLLIDFGENWVEQDITERV